MPKPTFDNLPSEKRERFVRVARDTFAHHPYDRASITQIVKQLGIAKGSVYQYFGNKLDLFTWLVDEAGRRKIAWFEGVEPAGTDPFDHLRAAYALGLRYWRAEPEWNRLGLRLMEPSSEPGLRPLRAAREAQTTAFLTHWLQSGIDRGFVRPDVDPATVAPLVQGLLSEGLLRGFLTAVGTDLDGFLADPSAYDDQLDAAIAVSGTAVDLLQRAIGTELTPERTPTRDRPDP